MLTALMGGQALTATELSQAAGVTLQTASAHLSKLEDGGLLSQRKQGRHRYFALADTETGALLETIMGRSEEHTSELQSLMRISYAVFCLKKKKQNPKKTRQLTHTTQSKQHTTNAKKQDHI